MAAEFERGFFSRLLFLLPRYSTVCFELVLLSQYATILSANILAVF